MIVGTIENGLERGFVKHRLNYVLIIDHRSPCRPLIFNELFQHEEMGDRDIP